MGIAWSSVRVSALVKAIRAGGANTPWYAIASTGVLDEIGHIYLILFGDPAGAAAIEVYQEDALTNHSLHHSRSQKGLSATLRTSFAVIAPHTPNLTGFAGRSRIAPYEPGPGSHIVGANFFEGSDGSLRR
jgi:hypothetical protein